MNRIRSLVRPTVTWGLVGSQVGLAFMWAITGSEGAEQAFAALGVFTMMVVRDWFNSRETKAS